MALLSAGKSLFGANGSKFVPRGLFETDPKELEIREQRARQYMEELKVQAQDQARRKKLQQEKNKAEDAKYQRIFMEEKAKRENPSKKGLKVELSKATEGNEQRREAKRETKKEERFNGIEMYQSQKSNPSFIRSAEQNQYKDPYARSAFDHDQSKLAQLKNILDGKLQQIIKQINQTKGALQVEQQLEIIRKKMRNTPQYESHEDFSQIQIPTRKDNFSSQEQPRKYEPQFKKDTVIERSNQFDSRNERRKEIRDSRNAEGWGRKPKGKSYLTDKEALDLKIDTTMANIDNILNDQS